jgi:hypothetical protein
MSTGTRRRTSRRTLREEPSPLPPLPTPLASRYHGEVASLAPSSSRGGQVQWVFPDELRWNLEKKVCPENDAMDEEDEDDDDYVPSDEDIESRASGAYRIVPIQRYFDVMEKNTVCAKCAAEDPPLITTFRQTEVTYGIATEVFAECNVETEHHDKRRKPHCWKMSADRREAPPGKDTKNLSHANFAMNFWLLAMMQFLGLGLTHIEALFGFLGLKGAIGNKQERKRSQNKIEQMVVQAKATASSQKKGNNYGSGIALEIAFGDDGETTGETTGTAVKKCTKCNKCGGDDHQRVTSKKCRYYRGRSLPSGECVSVFRFGSFRACDRSCENGSARPVFYLLWSRAEFYMIRPHVLYLYFSMYPKFGSYVTLFGALYNFHFFSKQIQAISIQFIRQPVMSSPT